MILTVDIGNSNITMGVYRENDLLFVARLATDRSRTGDQYAVELKSIFALYDVVPKDFEGAIISSVVPELTAAVRKATQMVTGHVPLLVGPGLKTGLNIRTDTPGILGADLVVGAVAAIHTYELPCLVRIWARQQKSASLMSKAPILAARFLRALAFHWMRLQPALRSFRTLVLRRRIM